MSEHTFSVGDQLIVSGSGTYGGKWIEEVVKITPKGMIRTDKGRLFYPNGRERIADAWHWRIMEPATPDKVQALKDEARKKALISDIKSARLNALSLDAIEKIHKIIEPGLEPF